MIARALTDARRREWEMFQDRAYFDMWCVRCITYGRDFDSPWGWHFESKAQAEKFMDLVEESK